MVPQKHIEPAPDFSRSALERADLALKTAMRVFDEKVGLDNCKFRIDMRRVYGAWRITFVYIPEAPDYSGLVIVHDNGETESFLK